MTQRHGPRFRLRVRDLITGPELRCAMCDDWYPITPEFWYLNQWSECRACHNERQRVRYLLKAQDPEFRARENKRSRAYRTYLKANAPELLPIFTAMARERKRQWLRRYRERLASEVAA